MDNKYNHSYEPLCSNCQKINPVVVSDKPITRCEFTCIWCNKRQVQNLGKGFIRDILLQRIAAQAKIELEALGENVKCSFIIFNQDNRNIDRIDITPQNN